MAYDEGFLPAKPRGKMPSRAERVLGFCELLSAPGGLYAGKPIKLLDWQKRFLTDVYGPQHRNGTRKVRRAIISLGRRQGKTLVCALLVLIHLIGPEKKPDGMIYLAANDGEQARTAFRMAETIIKRNPKLMKRLRIIPSVNEIRNDKDNIVVKAITAAPNTKLGQGPDLIIYDEAGNARTRELYDVLQTSLSSQAEPLMVMPSTQAATDSHWFSELIDFGIQVNKGNIDDPSFLVHLYSADPEADPFVEETWRQAQPSLGFNVDLEEVRGQAERAKAMPSGEPRFKNLLLNMRVQTTAPLFTSSTWKQGERPVDDELFRRGPVYGGLDLSTTTDLTSLVLAVEDEDTGEIHVRCWTWTPEDTLIERAHRDRAPYEAWASRGILTAVPGKSIGYDFVARHIGELAAIYPIEEIGYDRWKIEELKREFEKEELFVPLKECGQGYATMSSAIASTEHAVLEGKLIHGGNPVLTMAVENTAVQQDPAGNRKADKSKSFTRIDPCVAMLMAIKRLSDADKSVGLIASGELLMLP